VFLDYLSGKGFYVAGESRDNYSRTPESLASSLNTEYLDAVAQDVGETATDQGPVYAMLKNYKLWHLLKSVGYEFIHIGSWWEPTRENEWADVNINYSGSLAEFSRLLLRTTAVDPVGRILGLWVDERQTQYERVKYEFDRLGQFPDIEGPTFVFAHFLTPHPDYVFKSNGDFLPSKEAVKTSLETRYMDQLLATNRLVEECIDRLIDESDVPPYHHRAVRRGAIPGFPGRIRVDRDERQRRRPENEDWNTECLLPARYRGGDSLPIDHPGELIQAGFQPLLRNRSRSAAR
jgi:hypothetical protein